MKKHLYFLSFLLCLFWTVGITPAYSLESTEQILKAENIIIEESISSAERPKIDMMSILETVSYDAKTVYLDGLQAIEAISRDIEEFNYWEDGKIVDFRFLRSFESGYVTHALFEILGANGQYGYLIYDCENHEADSFSASESPYKMADDAIRSDTEIHAPANILQSEPYYFYAPMSYGYGMINANGLMDIYNIRNMVSGMEAEVLTNVSFETTKIKIEEERVSKIIGDPEAIRAYEAKKAEIRSMGLSYPNYYLISGVPDYQQSTGCYCIPTSMSNIIGYWDQNGYPDLVPTESDSNRENYIKENIVSYLQQQPGGTDSNASIDPAFDAYIAANGEYRYVGIEAWYPQYSYLIDEIYYSESPCMIGFPEIYGGGHSTTGVGYSCTSGKQVIVHDNWTSTAANVYQSWDDVDFLFSCMIRIP